MYLKLGRPKSISDLDKSKLIFKPLKRVDVQILVIDDEPFEFMDFLRKHDFNIKYVEDIPAINHVLAYDIIICDIKGVGKKLGTKNEGAHIISEIRKMYPFKTVIGYTGHQHDPSINKYLLLADDVYKKDLDGDELLEKLDYEVSKVTGVEDQWNRIKKYLLDEGLKLYDIALLENQFVTILNKGGDIKEFPKKNERNELPSDVRAVLQSFVASAIFASITGTP